MPGWFWRRLGRSDASEEVDREIDFHLEMRTREFEAEGYSREDARVAAESSFGDVEQLRRHLAFGRRSRSRRQRRHEISASFVSDVRSAVRRVGRSPGHSFAIASTLGPGVALAMLWLVLVNAYLVRALPFPAPDRLVLVEGGGAPDWGEVPDVFEEAVSWDLDVLSIVSGDRPQTVKTSWVSPGYFSTLGVRLELGRPFAKDEAGTGGSAVAVISHEVWQRRWGGDPDVLGRTFTAYSADRPEESEVFTIIGVLPADFWFLNDHHDVLVPLRTPRPTYMAKLRAGVARADAEAILRREAAERDSLRADVRLETVRAVYAARVRPLLVALGGAVLLVLLITFSNAASLVLVQAMTREREFAVRAAIGAGRARLARQLLAEGLLHGATASVLGVAVAWASLRWIAEAVPAILGASLPGGAAALRIDGPVVGAVCVVGTVVAVGLGVIPLLRACRPSPMATLTVRGRGAAAGGRRRARSVLVAGELALSLALLTGAALLVRSAVRMQQAPLGFDPRGVVAFGVQLRQSEFAEPGLRAAALERMQASIRDNVRGVASAVVGYAPLGRSGGLPIETPDRPAVGRDPATAFATVAGPGYFEVMGIAVTRGRAFDRDDRAGTRPVAVVSETLARRFWPGSNPIGQRIRVAAEPETFMTRMLEGTSGPGWRTVVGVVADVRKTLTGENPPDLYYPLSQSPPVFAEIVLRVAPGESRLDDVREAIWQVHPQIPLDEVRWLEQDLAVASQPARFLAWLISGFGVFAVAMTLIGMYGVVARAVRERRHDVAIRMALGASAGRVVSGFVREAATLVAWGTAAGLAGGFALSLVLRSQLYGVAAGDPATFVGVAVGLAAVALLATWLPARRAATTEPMRALQSS